MSDYRCVPLREKKINTYLFRVMVEPDEERWSAWCPALLTLGAATWGYTREEALRHINEVVQMIVQELIEDDEPIPEDVQVSEELLVAVLV